jgi:hypothetical protein
MNNQVRFPFPPTSDDEAEIPEVFAHAGMVLFLGQVLEHGIVNLLVCEYMLSVKKSTRRRLKNAEIATFVARARDLEGELFEETMGQLLKKHAQIGNHGSADAERISERKSDRPKSISASIFSRTCDEFREFSWTFVNDG